MHINPKIPPVLVFAIGNESRGDDALGPLLLRQLDAWLNTNGLSGQFELLEDYQLQIEHAMDMQARQLLLYIDAGMETPAPFAFYRAQPTKRQILYSHALTPDVLLKVYVQFCQAPPPDMFVLCIRGESFELGETPSPAARTHLASALSFAKQLLLQPDATSWDYQCTN